MSDFTIPLGTSFGDTSGNSTWGHTIQYLNFVFERLTNRYPVKVFYRFDSKTISEDRTSIFNKFSESKAKNPEFKDYSLIFVKYMRDKDLYTSNARNTLTERLISVTISVESKELRDLIRDAVKTSMYVYINSGAHSSELVNIVLKDRATANELNYHNIELSLAITEILRDLDPVIPVDVKEVKLQ